MKNNNYSNVCFGCNGCLTWLSLVVVCLGCGFVGWVVVKMLIKIVLGGGLNG